MQSKGNTDNDPQAVAASLEKYRQLTAVMEGSMDLLLGSMDAEEWLGRVALLAGCRSVACMWWREGMPETVRHDQFGSLRRPPPDWVEIIEAELAARRPAAPLVLIPAQEAPAWESDYMVYCLEVSPVRIVFIFADRDSGEAWGATERAHALRFMKFISKPVDILRRLSWLTDIVDLANKTLDGLPRGVICLTPDGDIVKANALARSLLADGRVMQEQHGKLVLTDRGKHTELHAQLRSTLNMSGRQLAAYRWHRNLTDSTGSGSVMIAMGAHPFDNWKLESSARDRVLIMAIQTDRDSQPPCVEEIEEFFRLTPAQARVAVALARDSNVANVAATLGISVNTVRTHLRAIYAQLGLESKGELTALIASSISKPSHED